MIGNKIKGLLKITDKSTVEACDKLGILTAAFYRKLNKNTFKAEDLIMLAELTGTRLAFIDDKGNPIIVFEEEDIKK